MPQRSAKPPRQKSAAPLTPAPFEPRYPGLVATACFTVWIALLSVPMLSGAFLASPMNDQYSSGYAYRAWAVEWWKRLGHIPLWNPEILGGMPFVAGMSGDVLYPTAWLRLVLPTHVAMNLAFVVHYILAGAFTYWFLRRWRVSWTGAVVGGLAYQLSGVIGSYVSPGHDGKLFVTTMLPLLLVGLTTGVRDRRLEGYALAALAVGLIMLSPHPQMAEYALLAAGMYTLFLVFSDGALPSARERIVALALASLAVLVGIGVSAPQYMPFYEYIPFSPRDTKNLHDFAWSAAYAIPWSNLPELVIPRFAGELFSGTYWGPNGIKLHSEYLGLVAVALALVGVADRGRRRMVLWLLAIAAVFMLIALGSATPFFHLWWSIVPFSKSTRAPGMALFIVSFVTATLAAFGTDRIMSGQAPRFARVAMIAGGAVALLGVAGLFGALAEGWGEALDLASGYAHNPAVREAAGETLRWSTLGAGLALAAAGVVAMLTARGTLSRRAAAFALVAIVGADLWLNARPFWMYSHAPTELFASDAIKARLRSVPRPFRVWDVDRPGISAVYPGAALMADDIVQLYGHHGNEPHSFDELNARNGTNLTFARAGEPRILELFAVNYLIVRAAAAPESLPAFRRTITNAATSSDTNATLFERIAPVPYARFVPAAVPASLDEAVSTVLDRNFPVDRVVLIDSVVGRPAGATSDLVPPLAPGGATLNVPVAVEDWIPGKMRLRFAAPSPMAGYALVSENWDSAWQATVDGHSVPVRRGDATLIAVPVPAGARGVELWYESAAYARGWLVSYVSLAMIMLGAVIPMAVSRRQK